MSLTVIAGGSLAAVLVASSQIVTEQSLRRSAADLVAARTAFDSLVATRTEFATRQTRLIAELSAFRAVLTEADVAADQPTIDNLADDNCRKLEADFCVISDSKGAWLGRSGLPGRLHPTALVSAAITQARNGRPANGIDVIDGHLFLVVSEPAVYAEEILGTLTAAYQLDDREALDLSQAARSDVNFVCGGTLCGSSLPSPERAALTRLLNNDQGALGALDGNPALRQIGNRFYVGGSYSLRPRADGSNAVAHVSVAPAAANREPATLVLLQDWGPTDQALKQIYRTLLWVGMIAFGVALAGGLVFSRRAAQPLRDLATAADELATGNWEGRVPVDGPAEARAMAEAFNQMTVVLREREGQLRQAQKMEAIGRLAGGVAHDFNNLLTAILGFADLLLEELPADDRHRPDVEGIRKAGRSAASLTRELLAFSRKQVLEPVILDMNEIVAGTDTLLRRLVATDVELVTDLAPSLPPVKADRSQLQQVLLNLAVNARDAMEAGGGRLTIGTRVATGSLGEGQPALQGPHVVLSVRDTGHGMTAAIRAHIFEPFFTTKELGKGTGLGLATVYGIVNQSGGVLWVDSEPGKGATFSVALPVATGEAAAVAEPDPERVWATRGTETVLLVEDNDSARSLAQKVLTQQGYHVLEARNGEEALALARIHLSRIAAVLTDVTMPRLNGRELAVALREMRRDLKIIFTSGYIDDAAVHRDPAWADVPFIPKPFTPAVLGRTLREVIDGTRNHTVSH